jgi:hypothetical protein
MAAALNLRFAICNYQFAISGHWPLATGPPATSAELYHGDFSASQAFMDWNGISVSFWRKWLVTGNLF